MDGVFGKDLFFSTCNLKWYEKGEHTDVCFESQVSKEQKHCEHFLNLFGQSLKVSYMNKDFMDLGFHIAHFIRGSQSSAEGRVSSFLQAERQDTVK